MLLKMVVCMLMELALNEDINNAEEGETTNCYLQGAGSSLHGVCLLLREVGKMVWLVDLDSHDMALLSSE